jgi:hypothetical protein
MLAPSLLHLSTYGTGVANDLAGLAAIVFVVCVVAGFIHGVSQRVRQGKVASEDHPRDLGK